MIKVAANVRAIIRLSLLLPFLCFTRSADAYDFPPLENAILMLAATRDLATVVEEDLANETWEDISSDWPNFEAVASHSFFYDHFQVDLMSFRRSEGIYSRRVQVLIRDDLPSTLSAEANTSYCDLFEGMVQEVFGSASVFVDRSRPEAPTREGIVMGSDLHQSTRIFESYGLETYCLATYIGVGNSRNLVFVAYADLKEQGQLPALKPLVQISCRFEGRLLWDGSPSQGRPIDRFEFDFVLDEDRDEILTATNATLAQDAAFSDAHVSWSWTNNDTDITISVNRYSGLATMNVAEPNERVSFDQSSGSCEVHNERKF